jgi:hypothetical protein
MRTASVLRGSAIAITLALVLPCSAQKASPAPTKKRTVYTPPPTGSLLGGGYADAGDTDVVANPPRASTLSSADKANFRQALTRFDAQSATIVAGYSLIVPAVKLQTGVPVETLKWQHDKTGMTFGELLVANSLAGGSGRSFSDILGMKNRGMSWTAISKQLGINIDSITTRLQAAEQSVKYAQSRRREKSKTNVSDAMRDIERSARPVSAGSGG